jgi:uncharacterized protein (TIGR02246 family)
MKTSLAHTITAVILTARVTAQDTDPNQANLDILAANAASFVASYNKAEPEALAKLFLPEGEIVLANGDIVAGRGEIAAFYQEILAGDEKPKAALEAGSVRFVTPGIAIEDGTLHVTKPSGEVVSHYYTAVQVKQETGSWLTASIRDEIEDHAPASEKLIALSWLVGDWLIEKEGTRTFLAFDWSEDGSYLDGKALTETVGQPGVTVTYRIGWNGSRKNFVSWGFDAQGGHTKSDWTGTDDGFLLRTSGVTADGEVNQSSQSMIPDDNLQGFTWSVRDHTLGGEVQPDTSIRVVKRPPSPDSPSARDSE